MEYRNFLVVLVFKFIRPVQALVYEWSKRQLFERFKPLNDFFSVVKLFIFEETYILLESPFHTELNGLCPISVYYNIHK